MMDRLMKIFSYFICAAGTLALMPGCEKDNGTDIPDKEESSITISVSLAPETRSDETPGDGAYINRCVMQAFTVAEDGTLAVFGEKVTVAVSDKTAAFNDIHLLGGQDYRLIFWADCTDDEAGLGDFIYNTSELPDVRIFSNRITVNDDRCDGFFGIYDIDRENGLPESINVTLKRPFGQLNLFATDYGEAEAIPHSTSLSFIDAGLPVGMNLHTGEIEYSTEIVTSLPSALPVATDDKGAYLGFCYIFAPDDTPYELPTFDMNFFDADGMVLIDPYRFQSGISIQANVKSNVTGALLTGNGI